MRKELWGWLLPGCVFVECEQYGHTLSLIGNPLIDTFVPDGKTWLLDLEECKAGCQRLIDDGEHPEWHGYEMMSDDYGHQVYKLLVKAGCLRVGTQFSDGPILHFEGLPAVIQCEYQNVKIWAESLGFDHIKMEPIKKGFWND